MRYPFLTAVALLLATLVASPAWADPPKAASCIAFSPTPGWKEVPNDGMASSVLYVHERTGAVIRAFIVALKGREPRDLLKSQLVQLANTGHRVITTSCCAIDSAVDMAWAGNVPAMKPSPSKKKARGKRNSLSGDDGTGRRGLISVRAIEKDATHAVVIVGTWSERDHSSLRKDVTAAIRALHLQ